MGGKSSACQRQYLMVLIATRIATRAALGQRSPRSEIRISMGKHSTALTITLQKFSIFTQNTLGRVTEQRSTKINTASKLERSEYVDSQSVLPKCVGMKVRYYTAHSLHGIKPVPSQTLALHSSSLFLRPLDQNMEPNAARLGISTTQACCLHADLMRV